MTNNGDKFITMVGFAKRAGKIVFGFDKLKTSMKRVKLLAVSDTASQNLLSDMNALADKFGCSIVYAAKLEAEVGGNVKALGLTDTNMAAAAVEYIESCGGDKYKIRHTSKIN